MVEKVVVDTNCIIEHSKGSSDTLRNYLRLQEAGSVILYVSTITIFEYYSGLEVSKPIIQDITDKLFSLFIVKEVNEEISHIAAYLNRTQALYKKLEPTDLLIAATAIHLKAKILTKNKKHFELIQGVLLVD